MIKKRKLEYFKLTKTRIDNYSGLIVNIFNNIFSNAIGVMQIFSSTKTHLKIVDNLDDSMIKVIKNYGDHPRIL